MTCDRRVSIEYADREFSVYINETWGGPTTEACIHCGESSTSDHLDHRDMFSVEITEMYDENGIDVEKNSKAFRHAKKLLGADGKDRPMCFDCRYSRD